MTPGFATLFWKGMTEEGATGTGSAEAVSLVVVSSGDADDVRWTTSFSDQLNASIKRIAGDGLANLDLPVVRVITGFENIPSPDDIGALSVVLLILPAPGKAFDDAVAARLRRFLPEGPDTPELQAGLLPVNRFPERKSWPEPISEIVGIRCDANGQVDIDNAAMTALINASLAVSCRQKHLFISYRQLDGMAVAKALSERLKARGYKVWRDEDRDDDGMELITPGTDAQRRIEKAIVEHAFVLLVDTPRAAESKWVRVEVDMAFGHLLPILPIVVEPLPGGADGVPPMGGRFLTVRSLGREVRLSGGALGAEACPQAEAAVDSRIDEIERNIMEVLLGHVRTRRRLVAGARKRFENLQYAWRACRAERLLFAAEKTLKIPMPISKRFLVQCAPYGSLLRKTVDDLCDAFESSEYRGQPPRPFNYAVLVHGATAFPDDYEAVLNGRNHVILLRPNEITDEALP